MKDCRLGIHGFEVRLSDIVEALLQDMVPARNLHACMEHRNQFDIYRIRMPDVCIQGNEIRSCRGVTGHTAGLCVT
jgi:hypothetical protein